MLCKPHKRKKIAILPKSSPFRLSITRLSIEIRDSIEVETNASSYILSPESSRYRTCHRMGVRMLSAIDVHTFPEQGGVGKLALLSPGGVSPPPSLPLTPVPLSISLFPSPMPLLHVLASPHTAYLLASERTQLKENYFR